MAILLTHKVSIHDLTDATSYTTNTGGSAGSFTPAANTTHYCVVENRKTATAPDTPTITTTTGLTFTQIATQLSGNSVMLLTLFEALGVPSPTNGTVTADFGANTQIAGSVHVGEMTGVDLSNPFKTANVQTANDGSSSTSSPAITLAAIAAGNGTFAAYAQTLNAGGHNQEAGWTELFDGTHASPISNVSTAFRADGDTTPTATAPATAGRWCVIGIELEAEAAVAAVPKFNPYPQLLAH